MSTRMIREDLLTSERYWAASPESRNLYISILLVADDTARAQASNFYLRTRCMAGSVTPERIEVMLNELQDQDLIRIYQHDGGRYIFVPRFRQRLRYVHSKYPAPPNGISDLVEKKTVSGQAQVSPKTVSRRLEAEAEAEAEVKATPGAATKAGQWAAELIGRGISVTSMHPTLLALIDEKRTLPEILDAVTLARQRKPAPEKIAINYIASIARNPPKAQGPQWWSSDAGIEAEAKRVKVSTIGKSREQVVNEIKSKRHQETQA